MTLEDQAKLKTLIESALAESVAVLKPGPRGSSSPTIYRLPFSQAWALVDVANIRAVLTDRAVKALQGTAFSVTVDPNGITITPVAASPAAPISAPAAKG